MRKDHHPTGRCARGGPQEFTNSRPRLASAMLTPVLSSLWPSLRLSPPCEVPTARLQCQQGSARAACCLGMHVVPLVVRRVGCQHTFAAAERIEIGEDCCGRPADVHNPDETQPNQRARERMLDAGALVGVQQKMGWGGASAYKEPPPWSARSAAFAAGKTPEETTAWKQLCAPHNTVH